MSDVIRLLEERLEQHNLHFTKKPILIGGMAMEYYGMRKSGADIDLVICDEDYQALARQYPDNRKDIWGDLGVVIGPFEIWRCIALLDYDFYAKDAIDEGIALVLSLDRLLLTRVLARSVPKYAEDLQRIENYYHEKFTNHAYWQESAKHMKSYQTLGGTVFGGKYVD